MARSQRVRGLPRGWFLGRRLETKKRNKKKGGVKDVRGMLLRNPGQRFRLALRIRVISSRIPRLVTRNGALEVFLGFHALFASHVSNRVVPSSGERFFS